MISIANIMRNESALDGNGDAMPAGYGLIDPVELERVANAAPDNYGGMGYSITGMAINRNGDMTMDALTRDGRKYGITVMVAGTGDTVGVLTERIGADGRRYAGRGAAFLANTSDPEDNEATYENIGTAVYEAINGVTVEQ